MHNNSCNKYLYEANERKISASIITTMNVFIMAIFAFRANPLYKQDPLADRSIDEDLSSEIMEYLM